MSRRQLYGDLNAVRALVADGLSQLDGAVGDLDHYWLNSARPRLRSVDDLLVAAAGRLGGWARTGITGVVLFLAGWATAAAANALGFSPAWVIVTTLVVAVLVELPLRGAVVALDDALNRRRLTPAAQPARAVVRALPSASGGLSADGIAAVLEPLLQARVRLVSTALRQVDSRRWRSPYLARLAADDARIGRIAAADLLLCQAIDYLEIYVDKQTKEPG